MTQAEKIKMLEAELKAERLEHEKAKAEIEEYKKREETFVYIQHLGAEGGINGFCEKIAIHYHDAPYGAGMFNEGGFHKALEQFIDKWNRAATEACMKNEFKKPKKGGKK